MNPYDFDHDLCSLRSRREWVPARTSVPNESAKSRAGREKNGEESSGFAAHPLPPATQANYFVAAMIRSVITLQKFRTLLSRIILNKFFHNFEAQIKFKILETRTR